MEVELLLGGSCIVGMAAVCDMSMDKTGPVEDLGEIGDSAKGASSIFSVGAAFSGWSIL